VEGVAVGGRAAVRVTVTAGLVCATGGGPSGSGNTSNTATATPSTPTIADTGFHQPAHNLGASCLAIGHLPSCA